MEYCRGGALTDWSDLRFATLLGWRKHCQNALMMFGGPGALFPGEMRRVASAIFLAAPSRVPRRQSLRRSAGSVSTGYCHDRQVNTASELKVRGRAVQSFVYRPPPEQSLREPLSDVSCCRRSPLARTLSSAISIHEFGLQPRLQCSSRANSLQATDHTG